jgi:hypothetical protein
MARMDFLKDRLVGVAFYLATVSFSYVRCILTQINSAMDEVDALFLD